MSQKPGRNDPCPCNSGKKYKSCCMGKEQQASTPSLGKRKFTAKIISGGGMEKKDEKKEEGESSSIKGVDYATLLEKAYGDAILDKGDKPPLPSNPHEYLQDKEKTSNEED